MQKFMLKYFKRKFTLIDLLSVITFTTIFFVMSFGVYLYILKDKWFNEVSLLIPLAIYFSFVLIESLVRIRDTRKVYYIIASLVSVILLQVSMSVYKFQIFMGSIFGRVLFICIIFILVYLGINQIQLILTSNQAIKNDNKNKLFNLFYVNFSKMHEIAMLIDNKIITTVEKERIHVRSKKNYGGVGFGKSNIIKTEMNSTDEEALTKRISENFDIKTTKSIMLRELYHAIKNNPPITERDKGELGKVSIFEDIELSQINMNNTVMLLKVMQDSNFQKSNTGDVEINMNSMVDIMFDDFTIDYTFSHNNRNCIIRFPYNENENFENGYKHSDFQLGKLSIIGINRGPIDFSNKDSIASNILEYISKEYNSEHETKKNKPIIEASEDDEEEENPIDFSINYEKLTGTYDLIDVIAIIQELNIGRGE